MNRDELIVKLAQLALRKDNEVAHGNSYRSIVRACIDELDNLGFHLVRKDAMEIVEALKEGEIINKLVEASERMMFLHMCEQEGITCGQPKPSDWLAAVDFLGQALEPFRKAGLDETKEQKQPSLNKSYTENKENVSEIIKELSEAREYYAKRDKYWDTCVIVLDKALQALQREENIGAELDKLKEQNKKLVDMVKEMELTLKCYATNTDAWNLAIKAEKLLTEIENDR